MFPIGKWQSYKIKSNVQINTPKTRDQKEQIKLSTAHTYKTTKTNNIANFNLQIVLQIMLGKYKHPGSAMSTRVLTGEENLRKS